MKVCCNIKSMLLFSMVLSDLARNVWNYVKTYLCNTVISAQVCTRFYLEAVGNFFNVVPLDI